MTAAVHPDCVIDPVLPLRQQALSLVAELDAIDVFRDDLIHQLHDQGEIRALARLAALDEYEKQTWNALMAIGPRS